MPAFGVTAGIHPDGDRAFAAAQSIGWIATNVVPVFVIVWFIHVLLVKVFHKWFKAVFLTIHGMMNCVCCCLLFFYSFMGYRGLQVYIPSIIICVAYVTVSPMLGYKASMKITDNSFALAHADQIGTWLATKIAPFFGDPEKDDADNLKLPDWLQLFSSMTLNLAITMPLIFVVIGIIVLIGGNATAVEALYTNSGGINPFINFILQGFTVAGGVVVLMTGLRMYLGSIIPAFQGFSEKLLPDSVPAVDAAAFFGYSQMGVLFGFIGYAVGLILISVCCGLFHTAIFVFPALEIAFFDGGILGVYANKYGGWKGALACGFLGGVVMSIGAAFLASFFPELTAQGAAFSNFDNVTYFPLIFWIFSFFR